MFYYLHFTAVKTKVCGSYFVQGQNASYLVQGAEPRFQPKFTDSKPSVLSWLLYYSVDYLNQYYSLFGSLSVHINLYSHPSQPFKNFLEICLIQGSLLCFLKALHIVGIQSLQIIFL